MRSKTSKLKIEEHKAIISKAHLSNGEIYVSVEKTYQRVQQKDIGGLHCHLMPTPLLRVLFMLTRSVFVACIALLNGASTHVVFVHSSTLKGGEKKI